MCRALPWLTEVNEVPTSHGVFECFRIPPGATEVLTVSSTSWFKLPMRRRDEREADVVGTPNGLRKCKLLWKHIWLNAVRAKSKGMWGEGWLQIGPISFYKGVQESFFLR